MEWTFHRTRRPDFGTPPKKKKVGSLTRSKKDQKGTPDQSSPKAPDVCSVPRVLRAAGLLAATAAAAAAAWTAWAAEAKEESVD